MGLLLFLLRSAHRMATKHLPSRISMNSGAPSAPLNLSRAAICHGQGFFTIYASMIFSAGLLVALVFGLTAFFTALVFGALGLPSSLGAEP